MLIFISIWDVMIRTDHRIHGFFRVATETSPSFAAQGSHCGFVSGSSGGSGLDGNRSAPRENMQTDGKVTGKYGKSPKWW